MKMYYYVGVQENGLALVTSTDGSVALWNEDGKEPKKFSKERAFNIVEGLILNLISAVVVACPVEIKTQAFLPEGRGKDE